MWFIGIVLLVGMTGCMILIIKGYVLYKAKGGQEEIISNVNQIQKKDDYTHLSMMSISLIFAIVVAEDIDFFAHHGISLSQTWAAVKLNLKERRIVTGGSSITQQLAKNLLFDFKRTYTRKIAELFAVYHLERLYTKNQILEIYLNCIEYGNDRWSIYAASQGYAEASPKELSYAQSISLAAIIPAPSKYNPEKSQGAFIDARTNVLEKMVYGHFMKAEDSEHIRRTAPFAAGFNSYREDIYKTIQKCEIMKASLSRSRIEVDINSDACTNFLSMNLNAADFVRYVCNLKDNYHVRYVWGTIMHLLDETLLQAKQKEYPDWFTRSKVAQLRNEMQTQVPVYGCDCSGLIKSYYFGGLNAPHYHPLFDLNSRMLYEISSGKGSIESLPEKPGLCLYMEGHVGIYIGSGSVIEATLNPEYGDGIVETSIEQRSWLYWFECPFVCYEGGLETHEI